MCQGKGAVATKRSYIVYIVLDVTIPILTEQ